MRYRAIHRLDEDDLIYELNKSVADGYRVISAGASYNAASGGLEWWAVVERDEKAQRTPEVTKNEAAELLKAARKIANACRDRAGCKGCPFMGETCCELHKNVPNGWNIWGRAVNV